MKKNVDKPTNKGTSAPSESGNGHIISDADPIVSPIPVKKRVPAAAVEADSFGHKILMSSLNGIYVHDLETGTNRYINPQYTRLTGYTIDDFQTLGDTEFFALFHPEDQERVAAHLEDLARADNDENFEIEYRFKRADGRWIWCQSRDTVFERDGRGRVSSIIGTFLDFTARKTAEKKLEYDRQLMHTIINRIPVMITFYDPGLQRFSFNHECRRILGWSEQDLSGSDPMEKLYPDPSERNAARKFMESLVPGWRDFKVTAKNGDIVESSWANIRLSEGTHVGIGIDIRQRTGELEATVKALRTEIQTRKDLEGQLRQWSRVFMDATDPIIIENLSGTIIDMNREAEREYGWKRQDLIGKSILSLIPDFRHQRADHLRERCRRGEEVRNWEGMRQDQKGRIFEVLLTAFPLLDEAGKIVSLATIAKDISMQKQLERERKNYQQYLRELSRKSIEALENDRRTTAKELHDSIGASLAAIKFRLEGVVEEIAQKPQKAAASLDETISHLHGAIRETKQISAKLRPTILDDLGLLSTIIWYTRQFSKQFDNIKLKPQLEIREDNIPDTLKIVIYRVLQESLHNAAEHSEATEVTFVLESNADRIVFEISDNGCGFDVQRVLSREDPLCGYGLANMIERAELVGGSLKIDSSPEKGTRIKMVLPLVPGTGTHESVTESQQI